MSNLSTVKPLYYGHQGDRNKCPYYRGVRFKEVGFIWFSVSQGPSELSVIERCPYYRETRKERFHCMGLCGKLARRVVWYTFALVGSDLSTG